MSPAPVVPRLHVVTDDRILRTPDFSKRARAVVEAGRGRLALQIRGPGTPGGRILELAEALVAPAQAAGAVLVINDRLDVALALGLDGVHLGGRSIPVADGRRLVGEDRLVGASVHSVEAALASTGEDGRLDYLVLGTIFATESHPERPGAGPELVARVARAVDLPVVAIGGITAGRVPAVLEAGAHGVAVLRAVWQSEDPAAAVGELLDVLPQQRVRWRPNPTPDFVV